jgi:FG-GAP-like repeat/FG-GAP repeat
MFNKFFPAGDADNPQADSPHALINPPRVADTGPQPGLEALEPRLLLSGSISAQFVEVDNSAALSGYKTYDLEVTADSDWSTASLLIELTQGSIYQDSAGGDREPNPVLFGNFPALEFDSYVAADGNTLSILGRAGEIGGDALQFDTQEIDITWFDLDTDDIGTFVIGRVTLSDDAAGSVGVLVSVDGSNDTAITSDTFASGDLVNLTPAPLRPPSGPVEPLPVLPIDFGARFVEVDNSAVLTGYRTFDLEVTTGRDWTASALLIELTQGSIYQDAAGGERAPNPFLFGATPTLEFDTYVSANGNSTSIAGAAGDVGGDTLQFDTSEIDIAWFDSAQNDFGTIVIGRFTLSDDAAGDVSVLMTEGRLASKEKPGEPYFARGSITGGDLSTVVGDPIPPFIPPPPPPVVPKPIHARFVEVDNSSALAGFKTFDLQIRTNTDWTSASLIIDLTQGSIYQDSAGTELAPNAVTFDIFPAIEFDTYVTADGDTTSIGGGGGGGAARFDNSQIDITWSGLGADDTGTLTIGRVTLSDNAVGSLELMVSADRNELTTSGVFEVGNLANLQAPPDPPTPPAAAAADFTGDGKADILWWNSQTGRISIWEMNRTALVGNVNPRAVADPDWQAVGTGDLTGDGKADILWRNSRSGRNMVSQMDGTVVQSTINIKRLRNRAWVVGGVGDFTGDGKADILWRNTRNGRNSVWEMDGTTFQEGVALKTVKRQDWSIAGVSDLTGDGKADILWRNTRNGRNSVWEMDGTAFQSNTAIKRNKSQRWQIAAVGDYTGDGLADIIWRDAKRGKNSVWQMDGTDFQDNLAIRPQADQDWQPAGTLLGLWE